MSTPTQCNTRPHPSLSVQALAKEAERYLGMSLPPSTKKTYGSGMRQFFTFCSQMYVSPQIPISDDILINFSVAMARSVQYTTIKNYLSAVKNYHSSHGYELHLSNFLRLRLILRGIKHSQGHQSKERRPITLQLLNVFYHLFNVQRTDNRDSLMFWAAMTFAFFGFLRIGELTLNSTFDPKLHLMNRDITFMPRNSPQCKLVPLKVSLLDRDKPSSQETQIHPCSPSPQWWHT